MPEVSHPQKSSDSMDMKELHGTSWEAMLVEAVRSLHFGSVEVQVHEGRVVQIETREKVRLTDQRLPDRRRRNPERERVGHRDAGARASREEKDR